MPAKCRRRKPERGSFLELRRFPFRLFSLPRFCAGPPFATADACRQEMKRGDVFDALLVNISERQDVFETIFSPVIEPACRVEPSWILERFEQHVPNREIGEVIRVMFVLMMNAVGFRPLNNQAKPMRRVDVPVVEIFRYCGQQGVVGPGLNGTAE